MRITKDSADLFRHEIIAAGSQFGASLLNRAIKRKVCFEYTRPVFRDSSVFLIWNGDRAGILPKAEPLNDPVWIDVAAVKAMDSSALKCSVEFRVSSLCIFPEFLLRNFRESALLFLTERLGLKELDNWIQVGPPKIVVANEKREAVFPIYVDLFELLHKLGIEPEQYRRKVKIAEMDYAAKHLDASFNPHEPAHRILTRVERMTARRRITRIGFQLMKATRNIRQPS